MTLLRSAVGACVLAVFLACGHSAYGAPPSNDSFSNALFLAESGSVQATNEEGTKEPLEPDHAGEPGGASVWFAWTAPRNGTLMVDTCDTQGVDSIDTLLAVYAGSTLATLTLLGGNDDACGFQSIVEVEVLGGTTYRIAVDGVDAETGSFRLQFGLQPANDDFTAAQPLGGTGGTISGETFRASHELGEPDHAGQPGFGSVWFRWAAPATGDAALDACTTIPDDTLLAVYTGAAVGALTLVADNDDSPTCTGSSVDFEAVGGTTYWIAVDGFDWGISFLLAWSLETLPRNLSPPLLTGQAVEGGIMSVSPGTWVRAASYRYEWFHCYLGSCSPVTDQNGDRLQIPGEAVGRQIRARVTAVNGSGVASADSNLSGLVRYAPPANLVPPSITGVARVWKTLTADPGTWWTGSSPMPSGPLFQWQHCDVRGESCVNIGSQSPVRSYRVGAIARSRTVRVLVRMSSRGGTTVVASPTTGVVPWTCAVPDVVGKTLTKARLLLNRIPCSFRLTVSRRTWSVRRRGIIVRQTPTPVTRLGRGGRIRVVVSRGRRR